jgi:hypothetical protein
VYTLIPICELVFLNPHWLFIFGCLRYFFNSLSIQTDSGFWWITTYFRSLTILIMKENKKKIRNCSCRGIYGRLLDTKWNSFTSIIEQWEKRETARKRWTLEGFRTENLISFRRLIIRLNHFNFQAGMLLIRFFCLAHN